ncbi:hypothetical protein H1P_1210018 [Hyella patelloides LEGE 07179]|uniref:DUF2934 domain-containing protein n=1 Tax=Hyella patelloides LEGE 07179 TaxID=945734 RepID=A0A563VKF4_9CYAN|nr:hypothetical protein [Hyella patelloides]VEP11827.1 hypothetical protein H1P_1210018 [Hyella patelloides LEGE 07179]
MVDRQQPHLSREEIKAKAYEMWQTRQENGEPGNAEADWQAAIEVLTEEANLARIRPRQQGGLNPFRSLKNFWTFLLNQENRD